MLKEPKNDESNAPYEVLLQIYGKGGVDILTPPEIESSAGAEKNLAPCLRPRCKAPGLPTLGDRLECLEEDGLVTRQMVSGGTAYGLTAEGLIQLQRFAERQLCAEIGVESFSIDDVRIEAAIEEGINLIGQPLAYRQPQDYIQRLRLNVWGRIGDSPEPFLVAKTRMFVIDAEAALQCGNYTLEDVLLSSEETRHYRDAILNQDVDGEPASHIYELCTMLGLDEAMGRQLSFIEDIRIAPALIGKRIGRRLARKLALRFGQGGGLVVMPVNAYGLRYDLVEGTEIYDVVTEIYNEIGWVPHPFDSRYLVADLRRISGLA